MYKTWATTARDREALARDVESHLNEFAAEVISVTYAVTDVHHALLVYRAIDTSVEADSAVAVAEQIIDDCHA